MYAPFAFGIIVLVFTLLLVYKMWIRLRLSRAKHRSLGGHSKWSRRIADLIPYFEYDEQHFFSSDGAPENISLQRREAFHQLAGLLKEKFPKSIAFNESLESSVSDVYFTNAYRVLFPYRN